MLFMNSEWAVVAPIIAVDNFQSLGGLIDHLPPTGKGFGGMGSGAKPL